MVDAGRMTALAAMVLLVPACQDEPSFDERYAAAETKVRTKAAELDSALAEADRRRAAEERAAPPAEPVSRR